MDLRAIVTGYFKICCSYSNISWSIITLLKYFMNSVPGSSQNIKVNESLENLHQENERNPAQVTVPPKV